MPWLPQRGPTAQEQLRIGWAYPVYRAEQPTEDGATVARMRRALSLAEAVAAVAGDDPRPLLVLRECFNCSGTDDALLTRKADNEKTALMSHWFHCVKLPPDVLEDDHPFRNLFPGDEPAHLFVATSNGAERIDLRGDQSRRELWQVMTKLLGKTYADRHDRSLKALAHLLDRFDVIDERKQHIEGRIEVALGRHDAGSSKLKKLQRDLAEIEEDERELQAEWFDAMELAFRETEEAEGT